MRISAIQSHIGNSVQKNMPLQRTHGTSGVSSSISASKANAPYSVLSFGGAKNKLHVAHYMAEIPPFMSMGGVATVADDYKNMNDWMKEILQKQGKPTEGIKVSMFMPYYNGQKIANAAGELTGEVKVRTLSDGTPIYIHANDVKTLGSADKAIAEGKYFKLEQIGDSKTIEWNGATTPTTLYRVLPGSQQPKPNAGRLKSDVDFYMVFSNETASMDVAYANGGYASYQKGTLADMTTSKGIKGNSYAQNNKAFTELLPSTEKLGFNPETVIVSDAQCCYTPEYMAQKQLANANGGYYDGLKLSAVFHNMADGYTENQSAAQMFANFASNEEKKAVLSDPKYITALKENKTEEYFQQFFKPIVAHSSLDAKETRITPNMIPLYYVKDENGNFVSTVRTVSCGYAQSIAENSSVSPFLHGPWKDLMAQGKVGGILNGFDKPNDRWDKDFPGFVGEFNKNYGRDANGNLVEVEDPAKAVFKRLKPFLPNDNGELTYEAMRETKRENKISLLERFTQPLKEGEDFLVTGNKSKTCDVIGNIDKKYVEMLKKGDNIPVFVSWGRGDKQKGYPITIKAFSKFAQTEAGKNAVLIMGGQLDDKNPEKDIIKTVMERELNSKGLGGRFAFIDGFAPGYPMASAADASILPSTFAPCELTDLESARYLSTPIVTNTQGMMQKNFDPRNADEAAIANAYKTIHEFCIPDPEIQKIIEAYGNDNKTLQAEIAKAYPRVEEETFNDFGKWYKKRVDEFKRPLLDYSYEGGKIPADIDEIALQKFKNDAAYERLITRLKENILADEVCAAMKAKIDGIGTEIDKTIFKNQMAQDTSWISNNALRSQLDNIAKSSAEMYYSTMVDTAPGKVKSAAYVFDPAVYERAKETVKDSSTSFMGKLKEFASGNKKALMITGAIAAAGTIAASIIHSNNKKAKAAQTQTKPVTAPNQQTSAPTLQAPPPAPNAIPIQSTPTVQQIAQPLGTTQAAVSNETGKIDLSNNKFAACFNKIA